MKIFMTCFISFAGCLLWLFIRKSLSFEVKNSKQKFQVYNLLSKCLEAGYFIFYKTEKTRQV